MAEAEISAVKYRLSLLPEDDLGEYLLWDITVEWRGADRWAVCRGGRRCLSADRIWDWEPIPSERDEDWLTEHRFDLATALRLAEMELPDIVVNGLTAEQYLARRVVNEDGSDG